MKVLAKLGLVTAAAAVILFIFIYEIQGPVINKVMSEPPTEPVQTDNLIEADQAPDQTENDFETPVQEPDLTEEIQSAPEEVPIDSEEIQTEPEVNEVSEPVAVENEPAAEVAVEPENNAPAATTRRIYGKITLSTSGEQLGGVNIMIPGSTVAKVSNPSGGYTIEVPENTRELVFIYRGKKLTKRINSDNTLVNVALNLDEMQYD